MSRNRAIRYRERTVNMTVQEIAQAFFCSRCRIRTDTCEPIILQPEETYMEAQNRKDEVNAWEFFLRCKLTRKSIKVDNTVK